jgi:hypothetical protein
MEKLRLVVWKHPVERQCRLPWCLSKEYAYIEYYMHGKVLVLRVSIKVLEGFPHFLNDLQPLRTFFLDFSHQRLLGRLTGFGTTSGQEEVSMRLDGRNPACAVSYHSIDSSPGMIRVSVYLRTEDVLHISHDG